MGIGSVILLLVLFALTGLAIWFHIKNSKHEHLFKPADVIVKEALGFSLRRDILNDLLAKELQRPGFSISDFNEFLSCPNNSKSFPHKDTLILRYLNEPNMQKDLLLIAKGAYTEGITYWSIICYHGVADNESSELDLKIVSYTKNTRYPNMFVFDTNLKLVSWA